MCEGAYRQIWNYRHDENPAYYTAFGIFQITAGTARRTDSTLDRFDPYQNMQLGIKIFHNEGTAPWSTEAGGNTKCWQ